MKSPVDASRKLDGDRCSKSGQISDVNVVVCVIVHTMALYYMIKGGI